MDYHQSSARTRASAVELSDDVWLRRKLKSRPVQRTALRHRRGSARGDILGVRGHAERVPSCVVRVAVGIQRDVDSAVRGLPERDGQPRVRVFGARDGPGISSAGGRQCVTTPAVSRSPLPRTKRAFRARFGNLDATPCRATLCAAKSTKRSEPASFRLPGTPTPLEPPGASHIHGRRASQPRHRNALVKSGDRGRGRVVVFDDGVRGAPYGVCIATSPPQFVLVGPERLSTP